MNFRFWEAENYKTSNNIIQGVLNKSQMIPRANPAQGLSLARPKPGRSLAEARFSWKLEIWESATLNI